MSVIHTAGSAIPIGLAFGVVLERAGLGDTRVIAGQFTATNFTVVRVMFGAIITAMLGVAWLDAAGLVDAHAMAIPPTDLAAQTLGAVIFGGGFALAALCPGTACVAAASGKREGYAAVVGLLAGTALVALLWPAFGAAVATRARDGARLPDDLGVPAGIVMLFVTVLGLVAFSVARRFDRRSARLNEWWRIPTGEVVALTLACAFALVNTTRGARTTDVAAIASEISREADHVDALELAESIKGGSEALRVIDVRDGLDDSTYVIPGATRLSLDSVMSIAPIRGERIVLYSDGGTHAAQAWALLRARGVRDVLVLKDGMAAWEDEVMRPVPPLPSNGAVSDTAAVRYARARALSLWFGGQPRLEDAGASSGQPGTRVAKPPARRRNTC